MFYVATKVVTKQKGWIVNSYKNKFYCECYIFRGSRYITTFWNTCLCCSVQLQWRHNERDGVSNYRPFDCFLYIFFQAQIKENLKASRHWPLWGEPPLTSSFSSQRASNAEMFPFDGVITFVAKHVQLAFDSIECLWKIAGCSFPIVTIKSYRVDKTSLIARFMGPT